MKSYKIKVDITIYIKNQDLSNTLCCKFINVICEIVEKIFLRNASPKK